jgi:LysR family glycine cleavage system transcriptional activator
MARALPLNALRAFDAAARHLSLTGAAKELSVTHGAVSRQVLALEQRLGEPLFVRTARGLVLTAAGRTLAAGTHEAFHKLETSLEAVASHRGPKVIAISTLASVAARWLVPKMIRFQRQRPDLDLRVTTSSRLIDLRREGVDLAIRYGAGQWPGLHAVRLFEPREFPVCAPQVARQLHSPAELAEHTLLHDMNTTRWAGWLKVAGVSEALARKGPVFEDMNVVLQAAIEGEGVALASQTMVKADLDAGRLVKPFDLELPVELSYWVVCAPEALKDPDVGAVLEWLVEEAAETAER